MSDNENIYDDLIESAEIAPSRELLEQRIRDGLFRDYVETGEALKEFRDRKLYRPSTFGEYVKEHFGCSRATAYEYIQGAEVAAVLSTRSDILLPVSHARLLFRLLDDPDTLRMLAHEVHGMTANEAKRHLIDYWASLEEPKKGKRRKRYVRQIAKKHGALLFQLVKLPAGDVEEGLDELEVHDRVRVLNLRVDAAYYLASLRTPEDLDAVLLKRVRQGKRRTAPKGRRRPN